MTMMARSDIASAKPRRCRTGEGECFRVSSFTVTVRDGDHQRVAVVGLPAAGHTNGVLRLCLGEDVDACHLGRRRGSGTGRITIYEMQPRVVGRRGIGEIRSGDGLHRAAYAARTILIA